MDTREAVARAICHADTKAPEPDALIIVGMKTVPAWEGRLPQADAAIAVVLAASVMTAKQHRDVVMKAICQESCAFYGEPACWLTDGEWPNPECDEPGCDALADIAIAAHLKALADAGMVVVPREPTEAEPGELRPCPFCGGDAERVDIPEASSENDLENDPSAGASFIRCVKCDACTALEFGRKESLESRWNCRAMIQEVDNG